MPHIHQLCHELAELFREAVESGRLRQLLNTLEERHGRKRPMRSSQQSLDDFNARRQNRKPSDG